MRKGLVLYIKRNKFNWLITIFFVLVLCAFSSNYLTYTSSLVFLQRSEMISRDPSTRSVNHLISDAQLYKSMTFTPMKFGPAFILSSTVTNSSSVSQLDTIHIYASMYDVALRYSKVSCCMKFKGNSSFVYSKVPVKNITRPLRERTLSSYFYTCPSTNPGTVPDGVGITVDSLRCSENHVTYIQPFVPQTQQSRTTLALCNKGVFGKISAELIIEWMETYRYLGVDKVVTYFLKDLNEAAKKVLSYYSHIGFVELYEFHPALEDLIPRQYNRSDGQSMSDRQMTVFDCHERMSGYTYFGVMDHDEFLIPSENRSLKQLLADLYRTNPNAGGFTFKIQDYFLSYGAYGTTNDLIIGQYITRAISHAPRMTHKTIYQPKYILPGGAHTHHPNPIDGKKRLTASTSDGVIRHYRRSCYSKNCEKKGNHTNDNWLSNWSVRIENNVRHVRKTLFGTEKLVV